jgi:hypothetical protein
MACSITITGVTGIGLPGDKPTLIRVSGTAVECSSVNVLIYCHGAPFAAGATVDASGSWTVEVAVPENSGCLCSRAIVVQVSCAADPGCVASFSGSIACEPGGDCPLVKLDRTVGGCNPDGTRAVVLTADITPAAGTTVVAQWDFGDGSAGAAFVVASPTIHTETHNYAPGGPYTAILNIVLPEGCPPVSILVGTVEECACPEVTDLAAVVDGCAGSGGSATVTLSGTVPPLPPACFYQWEFGDGTPDVMTASPTVSHTYTSPGTYPVAVTLVCGACIRTTTLMVEVPPCCPEITGISCTAEGCADGKGISATITCIATTNPPAASGSFTWSFGDGTPPVTTAAPSAVHSYGTPGAMAVQVTFTPAVPICAAGVASETVTVPECGPETPPPPPGGEGGGCKGLRWSAVILFILSALSLYICICVPGAGSAFCWASLALAVAAGVLLALWLIFCPQPCGWELLMAWQIALGTGIGALYFAPCCPWLWFLGGALILAAAAAFTAWIRKCKITFCQMLKELAIVISGVILPVIGWIAGISFLAACLNPIVAASVSTLAAAVAIGLASCMSS